MSAESINIVTLDSVCMWSNTCGYFIIDVGCVESVIVIVCCLFVSSYSQGVEYWIKSDPYSYCNHGHGIYLSPTHPFSTCSHVQFYMYILSPSTLLLLLENM